MTTTSPALDSEVLDPTSTEQWLSTHLHFDAAHVYGEVADAVIRQCVEPLFRELRDTGARFFFVRYSEAGCHVRVRVAAGARLLNELVRPAIDYYAQRGLVVRPVAAAYEPEVERYGGPGGVRLAESIFQLSSEFALEWLPTSGRERSQRHGRAMLGMLCLVSVFMPHKVSPGELFLHLSTYDTMTLRQLGAASGGLNSEALKENLSQATSQVTHAVKESWRALNAHKPLAPAIDRFKRGLIPVKHDLLQLVANSGVVLAGATCHDWDRCIRSLLPSYVHMLHNRFGVFRAEEIRLATIANRVLGSS